MTARQFAEARRLLGLRRYRLAEVLNRDRRQVARYERGDTPVPEEIRAALRVFLARHRDEIDHFLGSEER